MLISEAVHMVIHIGRTKDGHRKIESMLQVNGFDPSTKQYLISAV